jgi:curved DNA-binding protein CbpA
MVPPTPDQIPAPSGAAATGSLDPMARFVLERIDGATALGRIADECGIPVDLACRIAAALANDGLIALPGGAAVAGAADPEIAARSGAAASDSLEADVDRLAAELASLNFYELLSVEPTADRRALRSAYFALSKRYHPDRAFGSGAAALREKMERIFVRVNRAYETLSNAEERAAYDTYIGEQIELWKIERQLQAAVVASKKTEPPAAATPEPEPAAPPSGPRVTVVRTRSPVPAAPARPRALVTSIPPERRPPERSTRGPVTPAPEDATERREQWKKERVGRAFGMVLSPPTTLPRPTARELDERVERARIALDVGKNADAVLLLKGVLAESTDDARARALLARAEAGAAKELALGYLRQARYERQHGDLETARANYEKAIAADPGALDARHQLAEMLFEHRIDLRRAFALSREVIGLGGHRAKYFVTLGEILLLSKDNERAAEAFERALALEPDNKEIKKKIKICKG